MNLKELKKRNKTIDDNFEKHCDNCKFNFGSVCVNHGIRLDNYESTYGMPIDQAIKMFPTGCEDFSISFGAYVSTIDEMNDK